MTQTPTLQPPTGLSLAQAPMSQADHERKQAMVAAWKAYRGEFQKPLKVAKNQPDDNVISNRCAPIVDKGVSFLFGPVLKIEATAEAGHAATAIQDFLNGLWGDDDDKMSLLASFGTNGGVCGQAFLKLIPAQGQMQYPRIVVLDPLLVRIVTAPDDCSLVLAYVIEYASTGGWNHRQIIARIDPDHMASTAGEYDLDDTWQIVNYRKRGQGSTWEQDGQSAAWPYPFPPIFSCQNLPNPNESWGRPDLTPDLIEMNKVLNFIQSNTSRILKYHAHPKTWAKGIGASQISMAVDDLIVLQSDNAQLNNLEMHSNLNDSLDFAEVVRIDMDEQSRIPAVALGRTADMPKGNISGVALAMLFQPLLEKTQLKQRLYGRCIRDISRAALVVAGLISLADYEAYKIGLHWQALLPSDNLAAAQTALILGQIGVSESTLLQGLGYSPEDEAAKKTVESAQKVTNFSRGVGLPPSAPNAQTPPALVAAQDAAQSKEAGA